MTGDEVVRIIGIIAALVLLITSVRGKQIGLSDGLKMASLWAFAFVALALIATLVNR